MKTKNYFRVAGCWLLPLSLAACLQLAPTEVPNSLPYVGSPGISGTVVDSYGRPVAGALVWVRWETSVFGTHSSHIHCQHLDVVETDQTGRYVTPPWMLENPPWAFAQPIPIVAAYAPGYGRAQQQSRKDGPYDVLTPDAIVPRWNGSVDKRWDLLTTLMRLSRCSDSQDRTTRIATASVYRRIIEEMKQLPDAETRKGLGDLFPTVTAMQREVVELESQP